MEPVDLRSQPQLGLALGGGGALGAAHVGVLQVLQERNIRPMLVAGTSAGAIIGAAYANQADPYLLEDLVVTASWGEFGTLTVRPGLGLLDTAALRATMARISDVDLLIEDLPIRYAAVAAEAVTREPVVLDSGLLVEAMAASIAVPGLFRPTRTGDGQWLIDGGVVQNLPLETAFGMGAEHVIGVRLAAEWDGRARTGTAVAVHEWEIDTRVTIITPRLGHRSQWVAKDIDTLVGLGREAAEFALADYPIVNPRPPKAVEPTS